MWMAQGEGGQRLFTTQALELVIPITAGNYGREDQGRHQPASCAKSSSIAFAREADDKAIPADFDTWVHLAARSGTVVGPWPAECRPYTRKICLRRLAHGKIAQCGQRTIAKEPLQILPRRFDVRKRRPSAVFIRGRRKKLRATKVVANHIQGRASRTGFIETFWAWRRPVGIRNSLRDKRLCTLTLEICAVEFQGVAGNVPTRCRARAPPKATSGVPARAAGAVFHTIPHPATAAYGVSAIESWRQTLASPLWRNVQVAPERPSPVRPPIG